MQATAKLATTNSVTIDFSSLLDSPLMAVSARRDKRWASFFVVEEFGCYIFSSIRCNTHKGWRPIFLKLGLLSKQLPDQGVKCLKIRCTDVALDDFTFFVDQIGGGREFHIAPGLGDSARVVYGDFER